jgi:ribosomal protein S6--L-glutamate ligase
MILSFHPLYEGDKNIVCAGRNPDETDIAAIKKANAVILPQGCSESLYRLSKRFCRFVFPNYGARFDYPGKIGQIKLFERCRTSFPQTLCFDTVSHYKKFLSQNPGKFTIPYPFVFKYNWGGEGFTVFQVTGESEFDRLLSEALSYEKNGHKGFLIQEFVPCLGRTLRVAVIGKTQRTYWKIQDTPERFHSNLVSGARIDHHADPEKQCRGRLLTERFSKCCGINLAGFDIIFSENDPDPSPLMLELNYFFGRKGLGGSEAYYKLLIDEIDRWIETLE